MKERKPAYYAVIPAEVRYNPELSASEKILYGEITALAEKEGYCFASSEYFEKLYDVSRKTVYNWIKNLEKNGYVTAKLIGKNGSEGREIFITSPGKKTTQVPVKKTTQVPVKKTTRKQYESNNTSINTSDSVNGTGDIEFNSIENMSALQEIECQTRWGKILNVWSTTESSPALKTAYSKFKKLRTEHQQEVVQFVESLSDPKRKILCTFWISTYLKNNMFHPGIIDRDLEKRVSFVKPQKGFATGDLHINKLDENGNRIKN